MLPSGASSTAAGGSSSSAHERIAVRTWPMIAAAVTPRPTTSPTTNAVRPSPSSITPNQSPPTFGPVAAGRYRDTTRSPAMSGTRGSKLRASSLAMFCSRAKNRALTSAIAV